MRGTNINNYPNVKTHAFISDIYRLAFHLVAIYFASTIDNGKSTFITRITYIRIVIFTHKMTNSQKVFHPNDNHLRQSTFHIVDTHTHHIYITKFIYIYMCVRVSQESATPLFRFEDLKLSLLPANNYNFNNNLQTIHCITTHPNMPFIFCFSAIRIFM